MNNKEIGDIYEKYICNYLNNLPNTQAFLWYDISEKNLLDSGLIHNLNDHRIDKVNYKKHPRYNINPLRDIGIDILQITDNKYIFVQCKNGYNQGLKIKDLAGFYMVMANIFDKNGIVYYTSKLSINIRENAINKRIQYIKKQLIENNIIQIPKKKYELYEYQKKALDSLVYHFKNVNNNRGILNLPCGTGKTIIGCYFAKNYNNVIIISPLKQFAEQNMDKFNEYCDNFESLLIDSDGERNINNINKFIKDNKNKKLLFSATFKSVDVINEFIDNLKNVIVIIDEFHNLSRNNVYCEDDEKDVNDPLYTLLHSKHKILFQSATPRIYELENTDLQDENFDDLFGKIIYKMNFVTAINNNYIADYKIFIPSINENIDNLYNEINDELSINIIKNENNAKCIFLLKCLTYHNSKKCIVYCQDTNELSILKKIILQMYKFYGIDIWINSITSDDKHSKNKDIYDINSREWKLKNFSETKDTAILLSIKILDECIDVKECDSIYITYPSKSKIKTIQRICRCMRKDEINKNKIGHIYIWCSEYDTILETLSSIKEYDINYNTKIEIQSLNLSTRENEQKSIENNKKKLLKYIIGIKEYRQIKWNEWKELLFEYCNENKETPKQRIKYKNQNIGFWLWAQKKKIKTNDEDIYKKLKKNKYVKKLLDEYLEYKKVTKNKYVKKLLFEYSNEYKEIPKKKTKYKNQNIGQWLQHQKGKIKTNEDKVYEELSENKFVKESLDEYLEYKEKTKDKNKISQDEWKKLLFEYCNENKETPKQITKYKNQNIGQWLNTQKKNIKTNEDIYKKLSKNKYVKKSLDKYLEYKEETKDKKYIKKPKTITIKGKNK